MLEQKTSASTLRMVARILNLLADMLTHPCARTCGELIAGRSSFDKVIVSIVEIVYGTGVGCTRQEFIQDSLEFFGVSRLSPVGAHAVVVREPNVMYRWNRM